MKKRIINKTNIATIILFVGMLYLPTLIFPFAKDKIEADNSENRVLATAPDLNIGTITSYPKNFDKFYNDNLPFRSVIRGMWNDLNIFGLHDSTSDKVLLGKSDGGLENAWLFYRAASDGNPVRAAQGYSEYSKEELDRLKEKVEDTTSELKNRGIEYYVLIAPNKENVYKEFLPDNVSVAKDEGKADKLVNLLQENGVKNLIYPKQELIDGKKVAQTYYKQDTHWNDWGGFIGFREYMKVAESKYKIDEIDISVNNVQVDKDLAGGMLGIKGFFRDVVPTVTYLDKIESDIEEIKTARSDVISIAENNSAPIKKTILLVGDSYRKAMLSYFAKTYEKCIFMHKGDYKPEMIDEYWPDIVISENVERYVGAGVGWEI